MVQNVSIFTSYFWKIRCIVFKSFSFAPQKVEKVARIVKGVDKPFGGIQLIVCGDFLQLPPVVQRGFQGHKFCFQFPVWKDCDFRVYNLVKVHRQNDTKFIDILNNIRIGKWVWKK